MLFNLAQTLCSLTTSPVSTAVDQAHRMARGRLEAGGVAVLGRGGPADHFGAANFVLPPDIDPIEMAMAIEAKLRGSRGSSSESGNSALSALVMGADGRMVVPADCIQRLGEGEHDRGRQRARIGIDAFAYCTAGTIRSAGTECRSWQPPGACTHRGDDGARVS